MRNAARGRGLPGIEVVASDPHDPARLRCTARKADGQRWQVVVEPDAHGDVAPFAVKSPPSITAWANPRTRRTELPWHLHPVG